MDKIMVGRIVGTHGIKGELKILSDFQYPNDIFIPTNKLIIDNKSYVIRTYRKHKNYHLLTFEGYNNINEVLFLIKKDVYIFKTSLKLEPLKILDSDLINYKVLTSTGKWGIIKEIFMASSTNKIIRVKFSREVLIPFNSPIVKKVDTVKKIILVELLDGM